MTNLHELNAELARAVGVTDLKSVSEVVLTISAGDVPKVRVTRLLMTAEGLATIVEALRLRAEPDLAEVDVSAVGDQIARIAMGPAD